MEIDLITRQNKEYCEIVSKTAVEREWWPLSTKFISASDVNEGLEKGSLIDMPISGEGWILIGRLCPPSSIEPRRLRPEVFKVFCQIVKEWSKRIPSANISLAITSLGRSYSDQVNIGLGSDSYRSVEGINSSHLAGAAIDISLRSYYTLHGDLWTPVRSWVPSEKFDKSYINSFLSTIMTYSPKVLNVVIEKNITELIAEESVLHVCFNPNEL